MKRQSDCDIQNRLKEAAGQETPPLWGRIEAGLRDTRYSFEAAEEPATRKTWWRRPAVAVAASLFLVLAAGLTLLYPVLMPPASSTLEERVELSFKARADILGAPDYGLEGNRSESLRLIESYTEFQKVLARIGLQTAGETRVSTEVPYPREIEAELPYNETYFEKHVLLMLLYPWETGYAAEDVTGVSRTGTVLTVNLSQAAPREDVYAGLRQALFVEVEKTDVEDCDRFVFEVRASEHSEAETLQTMRYRVEAVAVNTENAAANRILTDTKGIADLKSRLPTLRRERGWTGTTRAIFKIMTLSHCICGSHILIVYGISPVSRHSKTIPAVRSISYSQKRMPIRAGLTDGFTIWSCPKASFPPIRFSICMTRSRDR